MCGRYLTKDDMEDIYGEHLFHILRYTPGEIFPGSENPVVSLAAGEVKARPRLALWGFGISDGRSIINARAESAAEKPSFRQSFIGARCVVPCSGFYEWSGKNQSEYENENTTENKKEKKKYIFEAGGTMFLAGLARKEKDGEKYVIITCPANESVREIHHRMPLVLTAKDALLWLSSTDAARAFLSSPCRERLSRREA